MKTTIGIDVGISTTKIVGVRDGEVSSPLRIRATDPVTSLYGAFGKYLYDNQIDLNDITLEYLLRRADFPFVGCEHRGSTQ